MLGTLLSNLKNREIELKRPLTDEDAIEVLRRGVKTRRESIEQYEKAGRLDLSAVEQGQIKVHRGVPPGRRRPRGDSRRGAGGDRRRVPPISARSWGRSCRHFADGPTAR